MEQNGQIWINATTNTIYFGDMQFGDRLATKTELDAWEASRKPSIAQMKVQAKIEIDQAAEAVRIKYLTPGSGQAMTYIKKTADAEKFKADGYPEADIALYPWLNSEVLAQELDTPDKGQTACNDILAQDEQLTLLGSTIEKIRRAGKIDIDKRIAENTINNSKAATLAQLAVI